MYTLSMFLSLLPLYSQAITICQAPLQLAAYFNPTAGGGSMLNNGVSSAPFLSMLRQLNFAIDTAGSNLGEPLNVVTFSLATCPLI